MEDLIKKIIDRSIDRLNEFRSSTTPLPKDSETIILGQDGALDSMGYVNFVVALEEELASQLGINVVLADEISAVEGSTIGDLYKILARIIKDRK